MRRKRKPWITSVGVYWAGMWTVNLVGWTVFVLVQNGTLHLP